MSKEVAVSSTSLTGLQRVAQITIRRRNPGAMGWDGTFKRLANLENRHGEDWLSVYDEILRISLDAEGWEQASWTICMVGLFDVTVTFLVGILRYFCR